MPPPANDRDTALKAIFEVIRVILQEMAIKQQAMVSEVSDNREQITANTKELAALKQTIMDLHEELRLSMWRVLLRTIERAADKDPIKTLAILGPTLVCSLFFLLGAVYSLIWHESPSEVLRGLLSLLPFMSGGAIAPTTGAQ